MIAAPILHQFSQPARDIARAAVLIVLFLLGSMLCGLTAEFGNLPVIGDGMNQLIVCRALQGLGAGALTIFGFATVAGIALPAVRDAAVPTGATAT